MRNEKDYYYFIKVKSKNQFFLHYIENKLIKTLRFNELSGLSDDMLTYINPIDIREYLSNKRL